MSESIKALIVDDEEFARENLRLLIHDFCEGVNVVAAASSAAQARQMVDELNPDLVFLDIMMPGEDGFSFLQSLPGRRFKVIFTTAFKEHTLRALRESAVDYLEKPIDIEELKTAVRKVQDQIPDKAGSGISQDRIERILQHIALTNSVEKTVIPTRDGLAVVQNTDIVHLEADENYTTLYLASGKKYVSSKNIRAFEEKLNPAMFFRVHKSHIINIAHHLKEFIRSEGNIAVLSNGAQVPVSRRKLQEFLEKIERLE